jgi:lyso-ornithine lipid O-acyltransferase
MSRARASTKLAGFVGMTVPLMPVQALFNATSPKLSRKFPHHYHRALCKWLGVRVTIEGEPPKSPCMIVCNHVSWLDIPVVSSALPVSFVARHDMAGWPMFGRMAKLQRTVLVDRSRKSATGDVRNAIAHRIAAGDTMVLFAEGSSHDGVNVLPFKSSFFAAAGEAEIVPATLAYCGVNGLPMTRRERPSFAWYGDMELPEHLWGALKSGPIDVRLRFHAPLSRADRKQMAQAAESVIRQSLGEMLHGRTDLG